MARPKKPLISRKATLEAALKIIDEEGLDALTIRRLGEDLNVRGISLYHHFKNKEEILIGVCELALSPVRTPSTTEADFPTWVLHNAMKYHRALCEHPNLIPVLTRRHPLRIGIKEINSTLGLLSVLGVPNEAIMALMGGLEQLALGSASYHQAVASDAESEEFENEYPILYQLAKTYAPSRDELFELMARATIDAIIAKYDINVSKLPARKLAGQS